MPQVMKSKLVSVCAEVHGEPLVQVATGSAIKLFTADNRLVGSLPDGRRGLGNDALPMGVALEVLRHFTRGDTEKYAMAKRLLRS